MEGDSRRHWWSARICYFNPLPPHGGRHHQCRIHMFSSPISIHSLRMEGDIPFCCRGIILRISIHSLRMEGDNTKLRMYEAEKISIHSLRMEGDMYGVGIRRTLITISIHSLRMEGDAWCDTYQAVHGHFNPLPPHGGRQSHGCVTDATRRFQSTPSAWRETQIGAGVFRCGCHFNPLPPHGGRPRVIL